MDDRRSARAKRTDPASEAVERLQERIAEFEGASWEYEAVRNLALGFVVLPLLAALAVAIRTLVVQGGTQADLMALLLHPGSLVVGALAAYFAVSYGVLALKERRRVERLFEGIGGGGTDDRP